jgi:penicillin-binding protein 2
MLNDIKKNKVFSRRSLFIGASQLFMGGVIISRLAYLQLFRHKYYTNQSDSNRIKPIISPAPRGIILDRFGLALANNNIAYRLLIYIGDKKSNIAEVEMISKILNLDELSRKAIVNKITGAKRKKIVSLFENLSWDDLAKIESNSHLFSSTSIEVGTIRRYQYPEATAHVVGYVSLPSDKEIDENEQNLFMHPDFRIGKSGIEKSFDNQLRGQYGVKYVEVNVHEVPLRSLAVKNSIEGSRVHLTIDLELHRFIGNLIANEVASVVVIDVETGELLASVSSPSFDPNLFVEGISNTNWRKLNDDIRKPLSNKVVSALYPPGSTFKLMVAIAALEAGVSKNQRVFCDGHYQFGKRAFHCWKPEGHGSLALVDAIMHSCNTYFFTIANQIGVEKIAEVAKRFGYGTKFDIGVATAKAGVVPNNQWKIDNIRQSWMGGDTLNTAIGQGFVLANPLQMAVVTARIANGGVPITPYLVRNPQMFAQFSKLKHKPLVKAEHLQLIKEGMYRVINYPGGTAAAKRIAIEDFEMAGKTGTSQVISKREDEMSRAEIALKANQNHAIFVGFAPFHSPRYAVSVVVEHGKSGSQTAAPIAREIFMELYNKNFKTI